MSGWTASLSLNGRWDLSYGPQDRPACDLDTPEIPSGFVRCPATVPGNVELDLIAAGVLPANLDHGDKVYEVIAYEQHQWWLSRVFTVSSLSEFPDPVLCLDGIDTLATIWLNGVRIGRTENMLIPHRLEVAGNLREGRNEIVIAIDSPILAAKDLPVDAGCFAMENNWESLHIRKASHSYGWDIMPRVISAGIWRDIEIVNRPEAGFEEVYLATLDVDPERERARLLAQWTLRSREALLRDGTVTLRVTDFETGRVHRELSRPALGWCGRLETEIPDVELWYPRGSGGQKLYRVTLAYTDANGVERANWHAQFGFRVVELRRSEVLEPDGKGEFHFLVNGREVFIKGSNWVPLDAFHSRDADRMQETLSLAAELDCNMVRCWGGNVYEPPAFFEFCDRNGILVWQDFALACALYPQTPEFHEIIRQEAETIVPLLRNHPCLALWSGNNEIDQFYPFAKPGVNPNEDDLISRQVLAGVCRQEDPYRTYLPSSPYYSPALWERGIANNVPEVHLWGPRDDFKSPYYTRSTACFASEIGYHGCPSRDSLERMMRPENLWPWRDNEDWLVHAVRPQPRSTAYNYRIPLMATQLRNLFGEVPDELDRYILASQISQAEALKYFVEKFRFDKGRTGGILWWNIRDGWPEISDAVVDYYGAKKLAFHLLKELHAPVHLMLGESETSGHCVVAVNDNPEPAQLSGRVHDAGKSLLQFETVLPENGRVQLGHVPVAQEFAVYRLDWTVAELDGQSHYLTGPRPFPLEQAIALYRNRFGTDLVDKRVIGAENPNN